MTSRRRRRLWLVLSGILLASGSASAQGKGPRNTRTLRGHTFPRPVADAGAFIPSQVGLRQGLLYEDHGRVTFLGQRERLTRVAALETLDLTVRIVDWLAIGATGNVQANLAASEAALYGSASAVAGGVAFGPALRVLRLERSGTQVTFRPFYQLTVGAAVDVSQVFPDLAARVESAAAAPPTTVPSAVHDARELENEILRASVTPIKQSGWGGSLHVAQTIVAPLGVQVAYGLVREHFVLSPYSLATGRLPDIGAVRYTHSATASLSLDASVWHVPLALLYETTMTLGSIGVDGAARSAHFGPTVLTGPGLYYLHRRWLQLGLHAALARGGERLSTPFGTGDRPSVYYAQFSMRAYFDD